MAQIISQTDIGNLKINEVASANVFQQMLKDGQVNENEIYLITGSGAYVRAFTIDSWSSAADAYFVSVPAATHGHGTDFCADVWTLHDGVYSKCSAYPGAGWTMESDTAGNVTLRVSGAEARFAGRLVIV